MNIYDNGRLKIFSQDYDFFARVFGEIIDKENLNPFDENMQWQGHSIFIILVREGIGILRYQW